MIKTNPLSVNEIKEISKAFRDKYQVREEEYFPILEVIDKLFVDEQLSYVLIDDNDEYLPLDIPAMYNANENFIYIKESVIEEYENNNYRAAFTLAHELFHYIQTQILKFDFEDVEFCKSYEDPEWQANEFAGQLLIPERFLNLNEEELINRYHVSLECVLTRKAKNKKRKEYKNKEKKYV